MKLKFEPSKWHVCDSRELNVCELNANCYAYALNPPDFFWAVPGMGFAKTSTDHFLRSATTVFEPFSSDEAFRQALVDGAERDGLIAISQPETNREYYAVVLFISEQAGERDFHWYRLDDDGTWSHKDGQNAPSKEDDAGIAILDPRDAKHDHYPVFGGFYLVPRRGIQLHQTFPLL